jgi:hypothetical protein
MRLNEVFDSNPKPTFDYEEVIDFLPKTFHRNAYKSINKRFNLKGQTYEVHMMVYDFVEGILDNAEEYSEEIQPYLGLGPVLSIEFNKSESPIKHDHKQALAVFNVITKLVEETVSKYGVDYLHVEPALLSHKKLYERMVSKFNAKIITKYISSDDAEHWLIKLS